MSSSRALRFIPPRAIPINHSDLLTVQKLLRLHCEGATAIAVSLCWTLLLAGSNSAGGASVSASAAVQAGVGIDRVDVAFLDCIGGAY